MARHNEVGKWGEELAAAYLRDKGYSIIERDWHSGYRDIDIIAITPAGDTLVFVEVKTRTSNYIDPIKAVDADKMRNVMLSANHYIKFRRLSLNTRFDIITIIGENEMIAKIDHIEGAFNAFRNYYPKRRRRW